MISLPSRYELYCNGYQPINSPSEQSVDWSKVPTSGSNAVKPNPNYVPPASCTTANLQYIVELQKRLIEEQDNLIKYLLCKVDEYRTCSDKKTDVIIAHRKEIDFLKEGLLKENVLRPNKTKVKVFNKRVK